MFHAIMFLSQRFLLMALGVVVLATTLQAQTQNYSLDFSPVPDTSSWTGTRSAVVTVTNNGQTTIPAGLTLYVEDRMYTWKPGRTLRAAGTPMFSGNVTLVPGSCSSSVLSNGFHASAMCKVTLNSSLSPGESFDASFSFTLSPGAALTPGGPDHELENCGTGWLTTPGSASTGADLPGWVFVNRYGGGGAVGCFTPRPRARDVSIRKTGGGTVSVGGQVNFTLNITNNGPGSVSSVTVTDTLPAGLTSMAVTSGLNWNCAYSAPGASPQSFSCTYVGPSVGAGAAFLPPIGVQATAERSGSLVNCAQVALKGAVDANPRNNDHCQPFIVSDVPPRKDVAIRKFGGGEVAAGGQVSFTLVSWNVGPATVTAGSVTITDTLPAGLTSITATTTSPAHWNCSVVSQTVSCTYTGPTIGSGWFSFLPPIFISATAQATGSFRNCAEIGFTDGVDSRPKDNTGCSVFDVTAGSSGDVGIRKLGGGTVSVGGPITFTLSPFNTGPGSAGSVTVTDIMPGGLSSVTATGGTDWACQVSSGAPPEVACNYIGTPVGAGMSFPPITISATTERDGAFSNCAEIGLRGRNDNSPADNRDCRSYVVTPNVPPNDAGLKKQGGGTVVAGDPIAFTLQPFNAGPGIVSSVTVTDILSGMTLSSIVPNGWTCTTPAITCTYNIPSGIGYLPPISFVATAPTAGQFTNCATITLSGDTDPGNNTDCRSYVVTPGLTADCVAASLAESGVPYSSPVAVFGGTAPYTFSVSGTLPPGLSLDSNTGIISGTPSTTGSFPFSVVVMDSSGTATTPGRTTTTSNCGITVYTLPVLSCSSGQVGNSYVSFGGGPVGFSYHYSVSGTLPPGLFLNSSNGTISGTPAVAGGWSFGITQTYSGNFFNPGYSHTTSRCITITVAPLAAACAAAATGEVGSAYSSAIAASGGAAPYTYSVSGTLPPGLFLNSGTGVISGTPTGTGSFPFTVVVTDSAGHSSATPNCGITISAVVPFTATCAAATTGQAGSAYSSPVVVSGGTAPYTYSVSGTLPPGLTLNTGTGVISGTPGLAGSFPFSVMVADSAGHTATTPGCGIAIAPVPGPSCGSGQVGVSYFSFGGFSSGNTYTVAGSLPPGLSMNPNTGAISGTPAVAGTWSFGVTVTTPGGVFSSGTSYTTSRCITISPAPAALMGICAAAPGQVGASYSSLSAFPSGGTSPYFFSAAGTLPPGLFLNSNTGVISGTPTAPGSFSIGVVITDALGHTLAPNCGITIAPPPGFFASCAPAVTGQVGVGYSSTVSASGGQAPYHYALSGTLPPGLALDSNTGVISGTPTTEGSFPFSVVVSDSSGGVSGPGLTATTSTCGITVSR